MFASCIIIIIVFVNSEVEASTAFGGIVSMAGVLGQTDNMIVFQCQLSSRLLNNCFLC